MPVLTAKSRDRMGYVDVRKRLAGPGGGPLATLELWLRDSARLQRFHLLLKLGFPLHPLTQKLRECAVTPRFRELREAFTLDVQHTVHKPELGTKLVEYQLLAVLTALGGEG